MSARVEDQQGLRDQAEESLKKKSEFWTHFLAYALIGWGIGLAFHAWDVFVERPPSEERIRREMDRLARQH